MRLRATANADDEQKARRFHASPPRRGQCSRTSPIAVTPRQPTYDDERRTEAERQMITR
jgi:hypothetical protein